MENGLKLNSYNFFQDRINVQISFISITLGLVSFAAGNLEDTISFNFQ